MKPRRFYKLWKDIACRQDLTLSAKIILAVIADRIGTNGVCWPGIRRLAEDAGIDVTTVLNAIKQLEEADEIIVERPGIGRGNRYRLAAGSVGENQAPEKRKRLKKPKRTVRKKQAEALGKSAHNETKEKTKEKTKTKRASSKETRRQETARRVVQAYIDTVGRPGDANTQQARTNVEKLLTVGHAEEQLTACVGNYAAGDDFQDDPQYRYKASNFYGRAAHWEAYTAEAMASKPTPSRIGCNSKQFAAELEAQGVIQSEEETT